MARIFRVSGRHAGLSIATCVNDVWISCVRHKGNVRCSGAANLAAWVQRIGAHRYFIRFGHVVRIKNPVQVRVLARVQQAVGISVLVSTISPEAVSRERFSHRQPDGRGTSAGGAKYIRAEAGSGRLSRRPDQHRIHRLNPGPIMHRQAHANGWPDVIAHFVQSPIRIHVRPVGNFKEPDRIGACRSQAAIDLRPRSATVVAAVNPLRHHGNVHDVRGTRDDDQVRHRSRKSAAGGVRLNRCEVHAAIGASEQKVAIAASGKAVLVCRYDDRVAVGHDPRDPMVIQGGPAHHRPSHRPIRPGPDRPPQEPHSGPGIRRGDPTGEGTSPGPKHVGIVDIKSHRSDLRRGKLVGHRRPCRRGGVSIERLPDASAHRANVQLVRIGRMRDN